MLNLLHFFEYAKERLFCHIRNYYDDFLHIMMLKFLFL